MNEIIFEDKKIIPSKVVCVGRNYVEHIKELGNEVPENMVLFCKPNSAVSGELRYVSEDNHYEGEISFLIIDKKIVGVGFGLDLTKREIQSYLKSKGLPWERAKSFDGAAVFSEFVPFEGDINKLEVRLYINDKLAQNGGVELMIYKPQAILQEIESFMSLQDGDIVMSGTPKGVGKYKKGDKFLGQIIYKDEVLVQKEWVVD
jgi:2-keto-4-pentenoate hydratase/2-oxohepta-3-ene-1,7-dioic acid hydratase in catechol pathway